MTTVTLTGGSAAVSLAPGYSLRAPGLEGTAELELPTSSGTRGAGLPSASLEEALAAQDMRIARTIDLAIAGRPAASASGMLRSATGTQAVELETPDPGPEKGQVVLATDESGVMRWHFPLPVPGTDGMRAGAGPRLRYRIDVPAVRQPPAGAAGTRSLLGTVGRKVLKVLVYPLTDPVVGAVSEFFAEKWEGKNRPYQLRAFGPGDYTAPGGANVGAGDAARLSAGRTLLFVHGTFSTAHGGFGDLPPALMQELHARYGGRVIAFNHHTLSHDPKRNVDELLRRIPAGVDVDIICHSRGGLVARVLAEKPSRFGLDTNGVRVKRVVFVGVPNAGTQLADPAHMTHFLDRMTSALNLFPAAGVTDVLEGILTAVKVIGHGALKSLDGLAAMNPEGAFLKTLNSGTPQPGVEYYAVAADFEPDNDGLRALLLDGVADRVFGDAANDLVVPQLGVHHPQHGGSAIGGFFPIVPDHCLVLAPGERMVHTRLFTHPDTAARIRTWLS